MSKKKEIPQDLQLGFLPPQAIDLEEAVLGAFMLDESSLYHGLSILKKEAFYKEANGKIFEAILALRAKKDPIDIRTVTHTLKSQGSLELVGGPLYVIRLTNDASTANTETYCRIIMERFFKRELIRVGNEMVREGYNEQTDAFDLHSEYSRKVIEIIHIKNQALTTAQLTDKFYANLVDRSNDETGTKGKVSCSVQSLKRKIGGYYSGEFIIIAGRPGMGKSALALCDAFDAARNGVPSAFFTLEMSYDELIARLVAMILKNEKLSAGFIAKGKVKDQDEHRLILEALEYIKSIPLYIWSDGSLSIEQAATHAQRLVEMNGVRMIMFDYLQLMTVEKKVNGREQEVSTISRGLKKLAMTLQIPIIALSQLNRDIENRPNKRPQLSDLRESGAIEQDANTVIFTYREGYYDSNYDQTEAELIVAKQRSGGIGTVKTKFYQDWTLFTDDDIQQIDLPFEDDQPF